MTDLIDTTEMYLRTIFELEEEGIAPLRARIAERLGHSGPTVSQTIARMERDGLVSVAGDRHLELSAEGRLLATRVMRKHRLAERLLVDVIGLELEYVHDEACRWEHVISDRVERKLLALLQGRTESPYGNPIPGLDEIGGAAGDDAPAGLRPLTAVVETQVRPVVVHRIGETVQADASAQALLGSAGLRPGQRVLARREGSSVLLWSADAADGTPDAVVPVALGAHVFVVPA